MDDDRSRYRAHAITEIRPPPDEPVGRWGSVTIGGGISRDYGPGPQQQVGCLDVVAITSKPHWEGPVEIGDGWRGFKQIFAILPGTPAPIR